DAAYIVTTGGDLDDEDLVDGFAFIMRPHVSNDDDATVKVDDMTAKPLHLTAGSPVSAEILVANTPYTLVYDSGEDAWVVAGALNIAALQADIETLFQSWSAPDNFGGLAAQATAPVGWT